MVKSCKIRVSARPLLCQGSRGCLHPMPHCSPHHSGDSTMGVKSLTTRVTVYCSSKTVESLRVKPRHTRNIKKWTKRNRVGACCICFRISRSLYQASVLKLNSESSEMVCRQLANLRSSPCCTATDDLDFWRQMRQQKLWIVRSPENYYFLPTRNRGEAHSSG